MKIKDLKVIRKVADNFSEFDWYTLSSEDEYYKVIEFPVEAEQNISAFFSEISSGLTIVVGAYSSRFYYEEDKYSWDKKFYVVIISTKTGSVNSIVFITNEEVENMNRKEGFFNTGNWQKDSSQENPIVQLYDSVNRKVSGIEDLYDEFLEDE